MLMVGVLKVPLRDWWFEVVGVRVARGSKVVAERICGMVARERWLVSGLEMDGGFGRGTTEVSIRVEVVSVG